MQLKDAFYKMALSRAFEEYVKDLYDNKKLYGTTHLSIGQEATHTGLYYGLDPERDYILPTHRNHGYAVAFGVPLERIFSELLGSSNGSSLGLGGSMHLFDLDRHIMLSSAVVASGVSIASGVAFALRESGEDSIAVAILGDGAMNRGSVYETMNISAYLSLPLLFYVENNHYGMSSPSEKMIMGEGIVSRAKAFGIDGERIDGNDLIAVVESVKRAREYILRNKRPYLIECDTYRQNGHSKSDRLVYRTREEEEAWKERDPIMRVRGLLLDDGVEEGEIDSLIDRARSEVDQAYKRALRDNRPLDSSLLYGLTYPEKRETLDVCLSESTHTATYREAIREALESELRRNSDAYLIGEEIGVYGGCFQVTKGLLDEFPSRVIDTPVSEEAILGLSLGASVMGKTMISEIMYGDFITLASDIIVNHAAKAPFLTGGSLSPSLVIRVPSGGGLSYGPQHSQSLESMFLSVPGVKIAAPSNPMDAKALLISSFSERSVVLFFEHKALYDTSGAVFDGDVSIEFGKGRLIERGRKLLVIGYSRGIYRAEMLLRDTDASFFDLRTLKPLDEEGIVEASRRFDNILIIQECPRMGSIGESILALLRDFKGGIELLSSPDIPIPFSKELEDGILIDDETILKSALDLLR